MFCDNWAVHPPVRGLSCHPAAKVSISKLLILHSKLSSLSCSDAALAQLAEDQLIISVPVRIAMSQKHRISPFVCVTQSAFHWEQRDISGQLCHSRANVCISKLCPISISKGTIWKSPYWGETHIYMYHQFTTQFQHHFHQDDIKEGKQNNLWYLSL